MSSIYHEIKQLDMKHCLEFINSNSILSLLAQLYFAESVGSHCVFRFNYHPRNGGLCSQVKIILQFENEWKPCSSSYKIFLKHGHAST